MLGHTKFPRLVRYRTWILAIAAILVLPPLSLLVQLTGDQDFCGTWCPRMFFVWRSGMTWQAYLVGFLRSYMGVALVVGMLGTTFFLGRYWCSHLCPIGAVMELGSRAVPRWLQIDYRFVPAVPFRYGYLSVYFLAAAFGLGSLCCGYCHFATIPRLFGASFSGADLAFFLRTAGLISLGLVAMLGFLARGGRAYCNLLCPLGALDALVNRLGTALGRRRVGISPAECNGCGRCVGHCPLGAIEISAGKARIDDLACMPCRRCEAECPQGAVHYGKTSA